MKRLTTDSPKDNIETALNLFYVKDRETWVRGGGPAPEYADVSLFDFTRLLVKTHIPDVELPPDNDDLSMLMAEWLLEGTESAEGLIATLYTAAWAFAELRHRLAAYEDTGLEPDDIKELCTDDVAELAKLWKSEGRGSMDRKEILETAMKCVCGDREQDYGSPETSFRMISDLWEPYIRQKCVAPDTDVTINSEDVAALMGLFKIARIATGHGKSDNWIDLAGYAACGGEIEGAE